MNPEKPITIHGLTQEQVDMLDVMWSMQTWEEIQEWQQTLTADQLRTSLTLSYLLVLEAADELCLDDPKIRAQSQAIIDHVRYM